MVIFNNYPFVQSNLFKSDQSCPWSWGIMFTVSAFKQQGPRSMPASVNYNWMTEARRGSTTKPHQTFDDEGAVKRAEGALRENKDRYRTLFDLAPVAVYSCDVSGVIRDYNNRAAELWGRKPELGDTDEQFCGS